MMAEIGKDFPQTREARRAKLQEIKNNGQKIGTVKVPGRGVQDVYRIPLQYLSYNPYNTRFLAQARTLEKSLGRVLRDDSEEDVTYIEEFIWKEKENKNASTIDSLIKEGQLIPGVVTIDGVVLSGNRRFRLLNHISRNKDSYASNRVNLDNLDYFEAAILDDELSEKDIVRYESFYQYGAEDKADYDPIQKYIAADEQRRLGFTEKEIADNFRNLTAGNDKEVRKWLEVYKLMEDYLIYIKEPGIFTALEGKEEAFLRLRIEYSKFKNGSGSVAGMWAYDENDLTDLKCRFFDYMRKGQKTHDFRVIAKLFRDKDDWNTFNNKVIAEIENPGKRIKDLETCRHENPDLSEQEISTGRANDFRKLHGEALDNAFREANVTVVTQEAQENSLNATERILQSVKKLLIQLEGEDSYPDELEEKIHLIQEELDRVKQKIS